MCSTFFSELILYQVVATKVATGPTRPGPRDFIQVHLVLMQLFVLTQFLDINFFRMKSAQASMVELSCSEPGFRIRRTWLIFVALLSPTRVALA